MDNLHPMTNLPKDGETIALVKTGMPADMIVAKYEYVETVGEPYLRILNGSQMFWPEKGDSTYIGWLSLIEPDVEVVWKKDGGRHYIDVDKYRLIVFWGATDFMFYWEVLELTYTRIDGTKEYKRSLYIGGIDRHSGNELPRAKAACIAWYNANLSNLPKIKEA